MFGSFSYWVEMSCDMMGNCCSPAKELGVVVERKILLVLDRDWRLGVKLAVNI